MAEASPSAAEPNRLALQQLNVAEKWDLSADWKSHAAFKGRLQLRQWETSAGPGAGVLLGEEQVTVI